MAADHGTVKRDMVRFCGRMYDKGLVVGRQGNLSARAGDGSVWMTPAGMNKGDIGEADLVRLDLDGRVLEGTRLPTSESTTHLEAYRQRTDVHAVAHGHPPFCTAFAAAGIALPADVLPEIVAFIGEIPLVPYGTPSSSELTRVIEPYLRRHHCFLLANHGALSLGSSVEDAYYKLEHLELYARTVYYAQQLGGVKPLAPADLSALPRPSARVRRPT
jgi:L-fuculose-phosphate aldolase